MPTFCELAIFCGQLLLLLLQQKQKMDKTITLPLVHAHGVISGQLVICRLPSVSLQTSEEEAMATRRQSADFTKSSGGISLQILEKGKLRPWLPGVSLHTLEKGKLRQWLPGVSLQTLEKEKLRPWLQSVKLNQLKKESKEECRDALSKKR